MSVLSVFTALLNSLIVLVYVAISVPLLVTLAAVIRVQKIIFKDNRRRVFIGIQEIANNICSLAECFHEKGFFVTAFTTRHEYEYGSGNKFIGVESLPSRFICIILKNNPCLEVRIPNIVYSLIFAKILLRCDVYIYIWRSTLLPFYLDYFLLKFAGKAVVTMHCGDDVRYRRLQVFIDKKLNYYSTPTKESISMDVVVRLFRVLLYQYITTYFSKVISTRDQATLQLNKNYHFYFPQKSSGCGVDPVSHLVHIVHAPSNRDIKGTRYVLHAINTLHAKGYDFTFQLIENQPNSKVLSALRSADILIDQPGNWCGRLAVEGMSYGCCVIGGNMHEYVEKPPSPVTQFIPDSDTLTATLEKFINNIDLLYEAKKKCYQFWRVNYSYDAFMEYFNRILKGSASGFYPIPCQKNVLMNASSSFIERIIVKLLYYPKYR